MQAVAKDVDFFKFAARIHEANESWQKAIACWEQVKKFNPNDQDASRKINAARRPATIKRAGLDDALDQQAAAAADAGEPAESHGRQARAAQARAAHARTAAGQGDRDRSQGGPCLRRAGRHLSQRSDLEKAEKVLAKGLKANPDEPA